MRVPASSWGASAPVECGVPPPLHARLLAALALAALDASAGGSAARACPPEARKLDEARFRRFDALAAALPGASGSPRETVGLPDAWGRSRPGASGFGAYDLRLPDPGAAEGPCAVYLPQVNANAAVWVNRIWIGQGGSMTEPVAHNFNRPLLFPFDAGLLGSGEDGIRVVLRAYADDTGRLGPVWVGPASVLRARRDADFARGAGLAQASTGLAVLTVLVVASLWVAMRLEATYGWFLVATGLWTFASLNYWLRDPPVDHWTWERLMNGALDQTVVLLMVWLHRFLRVPVPGGERLLWGAALLFAAVAALTPRPVWPQVVLASHAASLGLGGLLVLRLLQHRARLPGTERNLYAAAGAASLLLCSWDLLHYLRGDAPIPPLLPVALSLSLGAFGLGQVFRFARATREVEALNADLDRRVALREEELSRQYVRLRELERQRILASERERMMRDLHDGLGGRIVSALSLAESGRTGAPVVDVLRDALAEMRMVIDSLDPHLGDLPSLLAQVRARLEPVLEGSGVRLRWEMEELPGTAAWGPERLVEVLRIVQEALSNALRHAGAGAIRVRAGAVAGGSELEVVVEDDGCGIDGARPGRGLGHMRGRAEALGGSLRVAAARPGTRVTLRVPLRPPEPGA